jgi:hypothetical protein
MATVALMTCERRPVPHCASNRDVIGQTKEILINHCRIDSDTAFVMLKDYRRTATPPCESPRRRSSPPYESGCGALGWGKSNFLLRAAGGINVSPGHNRLRQQKVLLGGWRSPDTALGAPSIGDRSVTNESDVEPAFARYFPCQTVRIGGSHVAVRVDLKR